MVSKAVKAPGGHSSPIEIMPYHGTNEYASISDISAEKEQNKTLGLYRTTNHMFDTYLYASHKGRTRLSTMVSKAVKAPGGHSSPIEIMPYHGTNETSIDV
jgi:hypothetical protein